MAWQAHPATLPNVQAAANLRRDYYKLCIARRCELPRKMFA
jgi:hypothetical protein